MKNVPEAIINAATAMLTPYYPELSASRLAEALKHPEPVRTAPTIRKPLTRFEAAEILQVSIATVNRYMKAGTLRAYKISKRLVRIDPASVEALLQMQTSAPAEENIVETA